MHRMNNALSGSPLTGATNGAPMTLGLARDFDWSRTPLGPMATWPEALRAMVRMIMPSPVPMCLIVGPQGILIYNDGYAEIAGSRHPAIFGMGALDAWPELADFNRDVMRRGMAGESFHLDSQRMTLFRNGGAGEEVWLDLSYSPVPGEDGQTIAILAILAETTKRVRAEMALAQSKETLSFTLAASGAIGTWNWDLRKEVVTADARFAEIYGVETETARRGTSLGHYLEAVHPDDRDLLRERIDAAVAAGGEFRAEYRLKAPDGAVRWVLALGKVELDAKGEALRLPGVVIDITERKASEEALASSEAGFRALADSMPQMVWSTRADGFHDYYNARWYEFTGMQPGTTDGEGWNGMFHPDDQERAWAQWRHCLATGDPYQIEYRLRHHTGAYRWTLGRALPVRDARGQISRWFGTCTDIHESRLAAEEREIIAQELSHRIKNIFSVLTGIIALSARSYPDVKPFADQLRSRIAAMGKAHDFVRPHSAASRPTENQSSLKSLVTQLVAPFQLAGQERVTFIGDDAQIDDASATPLSLVVHELATNAAKYGGLASENGRVEIVGRSDGDTYEMVWKETGLAAVTAPSGSSGFGSRLISLSVEGQLGGTLTRDWEADGLRVTMAVPLAALSRSARLQRRSN